MFGFWGVLGAIAGVFTSIVVVTVGVVASTAIAPIIAGGAVIGIVACVVNAFGICPPPSSTNTGVPPVTITTPSTNTSNTSNTNSNTNNSAGGVGGNVSGKICWSAANATCGLQNQGVEVNGVCNATVPPDSACPKPIISVDKGFYADPALVKSGEQTTLRWNVTNATACSLTGGSLNLLGLALSGSNLSGSITQKTTYTLTCKQGTGSGPSATAYATVNLVPSFQNQ